jgi:diaminohydroxyphosphoribosylaminopyrimidine deaminase/5-amino-6-(5-phosphoribosylamino)uracil reductase
MRISAAYDRMFMQYAITLAAKGGGKTGINPLVGAVIVRHGKIVGQGYHRQIGEAHAEVVALAEAGNRAKDADLYVNLEPCCTHGYTPPCVDAIIAAGIKRVVLGNTDPNPAVSGKSIQILKDNDIQTIMGTPNEHIDALNSWYRKYITTKMPYVILKIATTKNMKISGFKEKYVTSEPSRRYVHALRSQVNAVLVGTKTVLCDNPFLTDRLVGRHNPARIVIDPHLEIPLDAHILTPDARRIVITNRESDHTKIRKLKDAGVELLLLEGDTYSTSELIRKLGSIRIGSILVEGGGETFSRFLNENTYDELLLFIAPTVVENGIEIEINGNIYKKAKPQQIGEDLLYHVYRNN